LAKNGHFDSKFPYVISKIIFKEYSSFIVHQRERKTYCMQTRILWKNSRAELWFR